MPAVSPDNLAEGPRGVVLINRLGIAELADLSLSRINNLLPGSDLQPVDPAHAPPGRFLWYRLADAERFIVELEARRPRAPRIEQPVNPDRIITMKQYADLIGVSEGAMRGYVDKSIADWEQGRPSPLLARPIDPEDLPSELTARRPGRPRRYWREGDAVTHHNSRPGTGRGERRGRPPAD